MAALDAAADDEEAAEAAAAAAAVVMAESDEDEEDAYDAEATWRRQLAGALVSCDAAASGGAAAEVVSRHWPIVGCVQEQVKNTSVTSISRC